MIFLATNKKKQTASSIAKGLGSSTTTKSSSSGTSYAGTNYQADIDAAVDRGDYEAAAKYEQLRNEKIDATGSSYAKTNNYSSYLNNGSSSGGGFAANAVTNAVNTYKNSTSGGSSKPSQYTNYTPTGTYNDAGVSQWAQSQIDIYKAQYNDAMARGDEAGMKAAHDAAEAIRSKYGYSGGTDGSDYITLPQKPYEPTYEPEYDYTVPQPTAPQQDPRIAELLNQILNRDDFSYNIESDPLYQQYAQMYQREGDRATQEALANAAAGAGGMNSYAMTAAMQAGNYYGSQLNDKIPELYQLAYDMYLADKESKVQDLGLLQNLDDSQYNRYRDTMTDWQNDRNFAYGMYRDEVGDSQWNKQFDYNAFVNDRDFAYNSFWDNKKWDYGVGRDNIDDSRYDKEWDYNVGQDTLKNNQYEQEQAREDVWKFIEMGIPPSAEILAKAGYSDSDNKYNGGDSGNYATVSSDVAAMVGRDDKTGAMTYLQEALNAGYITWSECVGLISKYGL